MREEDEILIEEEEFFNDDGDLGAFDFGEKRESRVKDDIKYV